MKTKIATLQPDGNINVLGIIMTPADARSLIIRLRAVLKSAGKTTPRINIAKTLFDSIDDGYTVFINTPQNLFEIKLAFGVESESVVPIVEALMEFHKSNESLNILIHESVMLESGAGSYLRYTSQFAQHISKLTQEFLKVRCIFNSETRMLGIFCRKSEMDLSMTFKGQLYNTLIAQGKAAFKREDIPDTYLAYPSMLLYTIRKKLPDYQVSLRQTKNTFQFNAKKVANSAI